MARVEFENDKWMVAVGVTDMGTGPSSFVQVWQQPHNDQDGCFLEINCNGVHVHGHDTLLGIPAHAQELLREISAAYERAGEMGNPHPNIDAERIEKFCDALGIKGKGLEIYRVLD